ncbi:hypothetical protein [Pedobacter rhodius]|uniref:Outer membrane protein beta-barrel domain-containing protein n=1 Tax=Pedobacter rhodius TaxID=3004098 RepID=A0ABT4KTK2_9SPHI|nr:hypothetical protein [Pedobacter sp. SJ11]MCZ4222260.1 hypothetical protein [Pedobacter sp. SJ11]
MDKELIDHIKDNLQAHEEAYAPGAWERFSVQEEKKRSGFIYWPLWSAAAIILIAGSVFFLQYNRLSKDESIVKTSKQKIKQQKSVIKEQSPQATILAGQLPGEINPDTGNSPEIESNSIPQGQILTFEQKNGLANNLTDITPAIAAGLHDTNVLENQSILLGKVYSDRISSNMIINKVEISPEKKKTYPAKITFEQLLEQDSHQNSLVKNEKSKSSAKWEPGIFVAPSMGNDNKVNMNYGFSLSYNLADKLSISSGIAYAALSTTGNPSAGNSNISDATPNANFSAKSVAYSSASKSLESVNANVRGINIPLELRYNINSKFYTGIGVSALAVLNNKQNNNYLVSSAQNTTVANTMGVSEQKMLLVTERVSEPQNESSATSDKYIGFYNFSLGYKQKISKKNNFAVEPFLRLPMKTFSNDNLNLTNGGVRLKFDF